MCGIHALVGSADALDRMIEATRHRGPDASGVWRGAGVSLGHNRLSILDLSAAGSQPMWNADKTIGIVYNGEVYNHRELRSRVPGHAFHSTGDTETLLALYEKEGIRCVDRLWGMYAFAIVDLRNRSLHLVRDPDGMKPLVYARRGNAWAFASEIGSIAAWQKPDAIDPEALRWYLSVGFVPAPLTFYRGIRSLQPGEVMSVSLDGGEPTFDWVHRAEPEPTDVATALRQGIGRHLLSDVPVGLFLSGGIDSSLLAAVLVKELGVHPQSFHIAIPNRPDTENARKLAKTLGLELEEVPWTDADARDQVQEAVKTLGQPLADLAFLPSLKVSKLAASRVKVVLSGDGADELFWGYGRHAFLAGRRVSGLGIGRVLPERKWRAGYGRVLDPTLAYFDALRLSDDGVFPSPDSIQRVLRARGISRGEQLDDRLYLPDDLLFKTDQAGMRYGLEGRLPFLDPEIRAAALGLSPEEKRQGPVGKIALRRRLDDLGCGAIINQGKQGFGVSPRQLLSANREWAMEHVRTILKRPEVADIRRWASAEELVETSPVMAYAMAMAEAVSAKWEV